MTKIMTASRPVSAPARAQKVMSIGGPETPGGIGTSPSWAALRTKTPVSEWGSDKNVHQIRSNFVQKLDSKKLNADSSPKVDKSVFSKPVYEPEMVQSAPTEDPRTVDSPRIISPSPIKKEMTTEVRKRSRKIVKERAEAPRRPGGRKDSSRPENSRRAHRAPIDNTHTAPEITFTPPVNSNRQAEKISGQNPNQEVLQPTQEQQIQTTVQTPAESAVSTTANINPVSSLPELSVVPVQTPHPENLQTEKIDPHKASAWKRLAMAKRKKALDVDIQKLSPQINVEIYDPATVKNKVSIANEVPHLFVIWYKDFMTSIKEKKDKIDIKTQAIVKKIGQQTLPQATMNKPLNLDISGVLETIRKKRTIWEPKILPDHIVQPDRVIAQPSLLPDPQRIITTEMRTKTKLQPAVTASPKPEFSTTTKNIVTLNTAPAVEASLQEKAVPGAFLGNIDRASTEERNSVFMIIRHTILVGRHEEFSTPEKVKIKVDYATMFSRMKELVIAVNTVFPMWEPFVMRPMRLVGEALAYAGRKSTLLYQVGLAMFPDLADIEWRKEVRENEGLVTKGMALLIGIAKILFDYPAAIIKNSGQKLSKDKIEKIFVNKSQDALRMAV